MDTWSAPYIELKEDMSNYNEYWNQPFEADSRTFASFFTGRTIKPKY